ncbi:MAG: tetraacyldisaccharide 4'-kinase [Candidatus Omnitrophota bacterium]
MKILYLVKYLFIPFSIVYYLIVSLRNFFYDTSIFKRYSFKNKVISVGNITWGGTGKTPLAIYITRLLLDNNKKPAILIRGYGEDEYKLFSRLIPDVPVGVGKDRIKEGKRLLTHSSIDTFVLDDGFQHRRIDRDLDIVCIDSLDPFGNDLLIPAGSMREPLMSLSRGDIFLITKVDLCASKKRSDDLVKKLKSINPKAIIAKAVYRLDYFYDIKDGSKIDGSKLRNKELVLVSGIASPRSFENTILNLGMKIKKHFAFRDHYFYSGINLKRIEEFCRANNIDGFIVTEKDAVKIKPIAEKSNVKIYVASISLEIIENKDEFHNRLFTIYNS